MNAVPVNDFTFYWIAAHRFLSGTNPYAPDPAHGWIMLAPPWILPIIAGLGALPLKLAQFVWLAVLVASLVRSVLWLWELYGEGHNPFWAAILTATFGPVLVTFVMGQIAPVLLMGLAGFLRYQQKREYLAGAFLFLVALKPQIAFLVWPALLLCAIFDGRWRTLGGFFGTFCSVTLIALAVRPHVFLDYWKAYQTDHRGFYDTAALGAVLRQLSGSNWLLYLPAILALVWFAWRWQASKSSWDWTAQMPGLLLISLVASPHVWFSDQVLLIPALFHAASRLRRSSARLPLVLFYFALNVSLLLLLFVAREKFWYSWIILVWWLLYAIGIKLSRSPFRALPKFAVLE
jgi:hypothetical protein